MFADFLLSNCNKKLIHIILYKVWNALNAIDKICILTDLINFIVLKNQSNKNTLNNF